MPLTVVAAGLSKGLDIYSVLMLDWPFDSGRKKTYLSQERSKNSKVFRPVLEEEIRKKKIVDQNKPKIYLL
ncbi:unnamed protein product [Brassica napus]|uniref:(rape) hypothetical protein n=1 Tax=Brassica napus TaxID=3708 RepID=A0A816UHE5_BRANA|nr:unnamed protein product [Brassica napus]